RRCPGRRGHPERGRDRPRGQRRGAGRRGTRGRCTGAVVGRRDGPLVGRRGQPAPFLGRRRRGADRRDPPPFRLGCGRPPRACPPRTGHGGGGGLTGVPSGRSGWLAVGHPGPAGPAPAPRGAAHDARGGRPATVPAAPLPVLMTSADGRTWRPATGTGPVVVAGARVTQ